MAYILKKSSIRQSNQSYFGSPIQRKGEKLHNVFNGGIYSVIKERVKVHEPLVLMPLVRKYISSTQTIKVAGTVSP